MGRFALALIGALLLLAVCTAVNRTSAIIEYAGDSSRYYGGRSIERIEFVSLSDLSGLTQDLGYTADAWQDGLVQVPRLVLTQVPQRFGEVTVHEISVEEKKRLFFQMILPLVLIANEEVALERARLLQLKRRLEESRTPHSDDLKTLRKLAKKYEVPIEGDVLPLQDILRTLERRIDLVPPSLALAQAASESAWGTSRFAVEGNALFGQWTFGGNGMRPEEQRAEKGDYKVAAFRTPLYSVRSYLRNLNTNPAYRKFRERRAAGRMQGQLPSGRALATSLHRYSERGKAYTDEIREIIAVNRLSAFDRSSLTEGTVYELIPVWSAGS
ncbi:glucosaminidase domain-containing protein [Nisaea sp.]|uniref:glucosaminidase domain-containing protein n=1 Tax=Nisaea sp. TaxID=2024842 RepID=UPI003B51C6C3